jgi:hypothetical protein
MSNEPDDPHNKLRKQPPRLKHDPEHGAIGKLVAEWDQAFAPFLKGSIDPPQAMREFMCYAFIAETNLKPSECALVTIKQGDHMRYHFENKYPTDPDKNRVMKWMEIELNKAKAKIRELEIRLDSYEHQDPVDED